MAYDFATFSDDGNSFESLVMEYGGNSAARVPWTRSSDGESHPLLRLDLSLF